jgi:hypothetical protein
VVKRALCFGLWEGIHWADQFEGTCETAHWTQTFRCHCGESVTLKRDLKRHTENLHDVEQEFEVFNCYEMQPVTASHCNRTESSKRCSVMQIV